MSMACQLHSKSQVKKFMVEKLPTSNYVIADKGYDGEEIRELIRKKSSLPIIPRKKITYWK